jgi:hypothetical protein
MGSLRDDDMSKEQTAILGLKRELKQTRAKVHDLKEQVGRWRGVGEMLRKLAGLDEEKFRNLLRSECLPCD